MNLYPPNSANRNNECCWTHDSSDSAHCLPKVSEARGWRSLMKALRMNRAVHCSPRSRCRLSSTIMGLALFDLGRIENALVLANKTDAGRRSMLAQAGIEHAMNQLGGH